MKTVKSGPLKQTKVGLALGYYRNLLFPTLRSLFYSMILIQLRQPWSNTFPPLSYYEFGVGWGGSLCSYLSALSDAVGKKRGAGSMISLFDTFVGLPPPEGEFDKSPWWGVGSFSYSMDHIKNLIRRKGYSAESSNIKFIKGNFDISLTSSLREELSERPPSLVTVDVDYYSSAKKLLDWIEPILHDGTMLYFDDIGAYYGNPKYGELRAINEFNSSGRGSLSRVFSFGPGYYAGNVFVYSGSHFGDGWFDGEEHL